MYIECTRWIEGSSGDLHVHLNGRLTRGTPLHVVRGLPRGTSLLIGDWKGRSHGAERARGECCHTGHFAARGEESTEGAHGSSVTATENTTRGRGHVVRVHAQAEG